MNSVPGRLDALPQDKVIVLYCAAGVRSFGVAHYLREQGYPEAWSLVGGIGAWLETGAAWERPSRPGPG
jgi:rhodanese-related sulfurtransferase